MIPADRTNHSRFEVDNSKLPSLGVCLLPLSEIIEVQLPSPQAVRHAPEHNQAAIGEAAPWHQALERPQRQLVIGVLRLSRAVEQLRDWTRLAKPQLVPKHLPSPSCGRACSRPSRP